MSGGGFSGCSIIRRLRSLCGRQRHPMLPAVTPTTPVPLPRPPIAALPKPVQEPPAPALKHPLPQPAQQGPPNKQARSKEFPRGPDWNPIVPMSVPPAVDLAKVGAPTPKDPPASLMPTPPKVQAAQPSASCAAAAQPSQDIQMTRESQYSKKCSRPSKDLG